jgi:hypothetical protein
LPTAKFVVDFWITAKEAWEYQQDYYPDDWDGYASFNNKAAGELCEIIAMNPLEWSDAVAAEMPRKDKGWAEYVQDMIDGYRPNQ